MRNAFVIMMTLWPGLAVAVDDTWWKSSYFPDMDTFLHMVMFVFWWSIAAIPGLFVLSFVLLFLWFIINHID